MANKGPKTDRGKARVHQGGNGTKKAHFEKDVIPIIREYGDKEKEYKSRTKR